ncbi:MAG: prolipoprotein diacylglyceryl transferase [bacterium]
MPTLAAIPSPTRSVWYLGPLPIRAYALCIIAGIVVAVWVADRRLRARGAGPDDVWDVAKWAVPFGILGGRIYHVITDPELYFTKGADPVNALRIWDGGLGIPGAVALGALGAWIGCRRRGIRLDSFGDAAAPGIAVAQAIGRWGNWFNNELYGRPTDLPWKLQIHCVDVTRGSSAACAGREGEVLGYFHPAFLYESLWDLALAGFVVWAGRRWLLGRGRIFALYIVGYSVGRFWVEALRSDPANHILGLRVNTWTCLIAFAGGLAWFLTHRGPREESIRPDGAASSDARPSDAEPSAADPSEAQPNPAARTGTSGSLPTPTGKVRP